MRKIKKCLVAGLLITVCFAVSMTSGAIDRELNAVSGTIYREMVVSYETEKPDTVTINVKAEMPTTDTENMAQMPNTEASIISVEKPVRTSTPKEEKTNEESEGGIVFTLTVNGKQIEVRKGVDEDTLKKSPGWLSSSVRPGEEGTCVIYGHRNRNHLEALKDLSEGSEITVTDSNGKEFTYTVERIETIEDGVIPCMPVIEGRHIFIATCYPFRYSGHAPGKLILTAGM